MQSFKGYNLNRIIPYLLVDWGPEFDWFSVQSLSDNFLYQLLGLRSAFQHSSQKIEASYLVYGDNDILGTCYDIHGICE